MITLRDAFRQWFDENQIPWTEHDSHRLCWEIGEPVAQRTSCRVKYYIDPGPDEYFWNKDFAEGVIIFWKKIPGPGDSIIRDDYIPQLIAELNYHSPDFFKQLKEAIDAI